MHVNEDLFLQNISGFLGAFFLCLAAMNAIAAFYCWKRLQRGELAFLWLVVAIVFVVMAPFAYSGMNGNPAMMKLIGMPDFFKNFVDQRLSNAMTYSLGTLFLLTVLFLFRRFFVKPIVAWIGPSIGPCCYEVGDDVAARLGAAATDDLVTQGLAGRPHVDLAAVARYQLARHGVETVRSFDRCTRCHADSLASYRRDGTAAGRNWSLVWRDAPS